MKINLFKKKPTEKKIIGTPNGGIQFSGTDLYYADIERENFVDDLKFFYKYKEEINLDKIHRLFLFFATTRTHELKNKYQEWMEEYYDKYKKPIFRAGERSRILPDGYFIEFVYEKILEWQK